MEQREFLKHYDENVSAIFRYIFLRVNSKETAQDLASEVFLRAWRQVSVNSKQLTVNSPKAFFYKVAKNLVVDFYRSKSRKEVSLEEITIQIPSPKDDPSEKTGLELELEPIKKALAQIKDDYAEVVIWHYLDELTISEIAGILDKSEGAVRVMLSRALEKVREFLSS
jgi:RNA polymerase sigma-70 factor (ECF subfamily)